MNSVQVKNVAHTDFDYDAYWSENLPLELSGDYIQSTLNLYKPESIAVVSADWTSPTLTAQIRNLPYPFTISGHIEYMTASMAMLYISQASYLAARLLMCSPDLAVDEDQFFVARDAGDLVFSNVSVRFRKKIFLTESLFELKLDMHNTRRMRSLILTDFACAMGNRACIATGIFAMRL